MGLLRQFSFAKIQNNNNNNNDYDDNNYNNNNSNNKFTFHHKGKLFKHKSNENFS